MLNLRHMLAEPKFVGLRQNVTLNEELDRIVALVRRQGRRHEPIEWLRKYDELECLRNSIADLESVLGRTASGIAESLLLHAYPRSFRLADGHWDDGRPLMRHAGCGAFALEEGPARTILAELRLGVAKATAQQVR